jgi:hypothetical protein
VTASKQQHQQQRQAVVCLPKFDASKKIPPFSCNTRKQAPKGGANIRHKTPSCRCVSPCLVEGSVHCLLHVRHACCMTQANQYRVSDASPGNKLLEAVELCLTLLGRRPCTLPAAHTTRVQQDQPVQTAGPHLPPEWAILCCSRSDDRCVTCCLQEGSSSSSSSMGVRVTASVWCI